VGVCFLFVLLLSCNSTQKAAWLEEAPDTPDPISEVKSEELDHAQAPVESVETESVAATARVVGRDGRPVAHLGASLANARIEPTEISTEQQLQAEAVRNLSLLRAQFLSRQLSDYSSVKLEPGPYTFGDTVSVHLDVENQTGQELSLISPADGLILEIDWVIERWLPFGGHDYVARHQWFQIFQDLNLAPGETFQLDTTIPLSVKGEQGAAWLLSLDARLRCDGAVLGDSELSMNLFDFQGAHFLAFPPGWQQLQSDPLPALERLIALPDPRGDRHVLVAAALLQGDDRREGVRLLVEGLDNAPSVRRAATMVSALQWVTRLDIGSDPRDWTRWWADLKKKPKGSPN
jgi:hypothetical protein